MPASVQQLVLCQGISQVGNESRMSVNGGHPNFSGEQVSASPWETDPGDAEGASALHGLLSAECARVLSTITLSESVDSRAWRVPASVQQLVFMSGH